MQCRSRTTTSSVFVKGSSVKVKIAALVLTQNDARQLSRCLDSLRGVVDVILVVDAFSDDETTSIAANYGAVVKTRAWVSYPKQFNWGLEQLDEDVDWVLRIEPHEWLSPELSKEIRGSLKLQLPSVTGVKVPRQLIFQGRRLRFGGVYPNLDLRLFRAGKGICENRWINESVRVEGEAAQFKNDIVEDRVETLSEWTARQNANSSREAVDLLNLEYQFIDQDSAKIVQGHRTPLRRWLIDKVYLRLPIGLRAAVYYFYRYFLRLGFLDGRPGMTYHFLQGFWYRYLVDAKVAEVHRELKEQGFDIEKAIEARLGIRVWRLRNTSGDL
jgi:glycosyltransferase involved in cell wall biosynthesis